MKEEERSLLEKIDKILRSKKVRTQIRPIVGRVCAELAAKKTTVMAWEPIPLTTFGDALPPGIESGWVFILRAGANTGPERHPNSHQRMMSFEGTGDMQIGTESAASKIQWQSNVLVSDPAAPLERRWVSIPQDVWHQPVVAKGADWVVVSFHTVPAEELIEERPDSGGASGTKQMLYLSK